MNKIEPFILSADIEVEYDYDPGEDQTYTEPGFGPSIEINTVSINGIPFPIASIPQDFLNQIESDILEVYAKESADCEADTEAEEPELDLEEPEEDE